VLSGAGTLGTADVISSVTGDNTLSGVGEVGGTVTLTYGSASLGSAAVAADGTWSYALTSSNLDTLGQGTGKVVTVSQTDAAGNTGAGVRTVAVDTIAPTLSDVRSNFLVGQTTYASGFTVKSGDLRATDVDSSAAFNVLNAVEGANGYGKFSVDAAGHWTYTMDSAHTEFIKGRTYQDSILVSTADGTQHTITVNMVGASTIAEKVSITSETSSNVTNTLAKAGDVITANFTTSDTVSRVTIGGHAASVTHGVGNNYTATYTVVSGDDAAGSAVVVESLHADANQSSAN